ncbi:hypothetical protein PIROE2DRAFT_63558 [Piromyces sp. E2]|nr:hypothetical protein PIROE2DRAFT_63558 [Piromyces sp. E2]|eukprot:OUM59779.1 hypothetical protein PIROE2DRAFT_63558 [Piromyces sp. E2]
MVSASLILIGETGNGKSSLGNFILNKKEVFSVSDNPESETKITIGEHGDNENRDIFVIDTPGLKDAEETDKKHLGQMVDYIKENPGLQGIVIVFNYHCPRLPMNIKTLIKLLCNVFPDADFWKHVALVWTRYYSCLTEKLKKKFEIANAKFMPEVLRLVKECNGDNSIKSFPTFFVDSDFEEQDQFSREEINRLIAWVHSLDPIDVTRVEKADPDIDKTIEEEDVREIKTIEGNVEHIKIEYFKRNKVIHYDGSISYTDWEKYKEEEKENILPRKLLEEKIETKEEKNESSTPIMEKCNDGGNSGGLNINLEPISLGPISIKGNIPINIGSKGCSTRCVGNKKTTTINYYKRTVKIYNDNTVEYGEWEKYDTKTIQS